MLKLYGTWVAETSAQSSQVIIRDYLLESVRISSEDNVANSDVFDTYNILANFADKEYQQVHQAADMHKVDSDSFVLGTSLYKIGGFPEDHSECRKIQAEGTGDEKKRKTER